MESESYPVGPASPPWSSSSGSSSGSEPWSTPTPLPRSATPSSSSDITVRPGVSDLCDLPDHIKDQGAALWEGRVSTNHMLDELRDQRPDNTELLDRLAREELVQQALYRNRKVPVSEDGSIYGTGSDVRY
jgi:hypothetical protein